MTARWKCDLCPEHGEEPTRKQATRAWERHYYAVHLGEE